MNQVEALKEKIKFLNNKIECIQKSCPHPPESVKIHHFTAWGEICDGWNNGNTYPIPSTRFTCKSCEAQWTLEENITPKQYEGEWRIAAAKKKPGTNKIAKKIAANKTSKKAIKKATKRKISAV